jgi:PAS domain S-box-containing protein
MALRPVEPLELSHSWPLFERGRRFEVGQELVADGYPVIDITRDALTFTDRGLGLFDCLLADNSLSWSNGVYDLFGFPRGTIVTRAETLAVYAEHSRVLLERLRAHAIRHRRGFTMDAELRPASGGPRWMRLIAAPVCEGGRVVRIQGVKRDVTDEYR